MGPCGISRGPLYSYFDSCANAPPHPRYHAPLDSERPSVSGYVKGKILLLQEVFDKTSADQLYKNTFYLDELTAVYTKLLLRSWPLGEHCTRTEQNVDNDFGPAEKYVFEHVPGG